MEFDRGWMMNSDIQRMINKILGMKVFLMGGSDATPVGNVGDALKVSSSTNDQPLTSKLRCEILTSQIVLSAGVYTNVYTYTGTGLLLGFNLEFNNTSVIVRLKIDGETVLDGVSLGTLNGLLGTANNTARYQNGSGIVTSSSAIDFSLRKAIRFATSVEIAAHPNGGLFTRTFTQGIVYITKET